ncbi:hypothetical protein [Nocardia terpenica]|uniref:Uncharacterized protein n=1 Tax=Nocardia terpenica TaxID=455432 RepID=A0A6G9Z5A0_9NOCA|nr:hypothetical protein [Nocardia terpenica]QIS20644.1 hypothetical protein F6W96_22415 [Nocardia terpenica]
MLDGTISSSYPPAGVRNTGTGRAAAVPGDAAVTMATAHRLAPSALVKYLDTSATVAMTDRSVKLG